MTRRLRPLQALVLGFALVASPARAMTLDATTAFSGAPVRLTGRVLSLRPDVPARQTEVVLGDAAGREVARFYTLGVRSGRMQWVAEGAPVFVTGERVEVALRSTSTGYALARVPEGESAVRRLEPGVDGTDGGAFERAALGIPSTVTDLEPPNGGAVPDDPDIVSVRGAGFGATQGDSRVTFQGIFERVDAAVVSWSDKEIVCRVPAPGLRGDPQVLSGPIKVWTAEGGWSDGDPFVGGSRFSVLYQWAGDSWPDARLPIAVWAHPDGSAYADQFGDLVTEAASQWNVPGAYARLVYRGTTPVTGGNHGDDDTPEDGRNTITWRGEWPYAPGILALTWSAIDTVTFERREVEMEINGTRPWTLDPEGEPNKFDLISTMTHEFGHWLRLGHTQSVPSVMAAFASPGERRRQISVGDSFGASWIHPSYGVALFPAALATSAALEVPVTALDRQGVPLPQLFKGVIEVKAIRLEEGETVGPLDPPLARLPDGAVNANKDTDDDGRTTVTLAGLADGRYRVETTIENRFVRPAGIVRIGPAPTPLEPVLALSGVRPSPLVPGARGRVAFTLPAAGDVTLDLYDARGRRAQSIVSGRFEAGPHEVTIETIGRDGRSLGAGVYFLRLSGAGVGVRTSRVVLLP
jgi:hypothetical protein